MARISYGVMEVAKMLPQTRKWIRIGFAGPGALIVAQIVMPGMALWLPRGAAGIDNLVLPLVLVPLIWAALFFHACLDPRLSRVAIIALGLFAVHFGLAAHKLADAAPAQAESQK